MDTFDASDFLRDFDNLEPVDKRVYIYIFVFFHISVNNNYTILAIAMELSLIPADFNNNKDFLSQAIEIADIS